MGFIKQYLAYLKILSQTIGAYAVVALISLTGLPIPGKFAALAIFLFAIPLLLALRDVSGADWYD